MPFKQTLMLKQYFFIAMISLLGSHTVTSQTISKQRLTQIIDSLYQADQSTARIKPADSAAAAYQRVIRSNFYLVTTIFKQFGYPGYDLVGKEASNKYFLLVQHSDFDVRFQQNVLNEMKKQVDNQNASGQSFAYLTDRIELNSGRLQIYGTQIFMNGNSIIKPCVDTLNLDNRRKSVGLSPIKEYLEKCNDAFYQMNPQEKRPNSNN
jgi:hypothetical protein